jgi:hypothetical protein
VATSVVKGRLLRAKKLLERYISAGLVPFELSWDSTDLRAILPPLIMSNREGMLYLIDGVHRAMVLLEAGNQKMSAALLYPAREPCGDLVDWSEMEIRSMQSIDHATLFRNFKYELFFDVTTITERAKSYEDSARVAKVLNRSGLLPEI